MADNSVIRFNAIIPRKFNAKAFEANLNDRLTDVGKLIYGDFRDTVQTWQKRVYFKTTRARTQGTLSIKVDTNSKVYFMVNEGTRPHIIRPRRAKWLKYRGKFTPKTTPRWIGSRPGGKFGKFVRRKIVRHPGFAAREFDSAIADSRRADAVRILNEAMRRAVMESGHGI